MAPRIVTLNGKSQREFAHQLIDMAPDGYRVEFKEPRRSDAANDALWAMLTDISQQVVWHSLRLSPEDWKHVLSASLKRETRAVPAIDGQGFVILGQRTSRMSKAEFADLLSLVEAFGAQQGVTFRAPARQEPAHA